MDVCESLLGYSFANQSYVVDTSANYTNVYNTTSTTIVTDIIIRPPYFIVAHPTHI